MNQVENTFLIGEGHYIIHARRKDTGNYEIIAPQIFKRNKKFLFLKFIEYHQDKILTKEESLILAKEAMKSGKYQDVLILRDNGSDPEGYHGPYCPTVIFHNDSWTNYAVRYACAIDAFNSNKNATVIEIKKKKIRKKSFWFKCLNFISSFKKKKRRVRKKKVINNDKK